MADRLQGVGVGTGIAIGPLYKMGRPPELSSKRVMFSWELTINRSIQMGTIFTRSTESFP